MAHDFEINNTIDLSLKSTYNMPITQEMMDMFRASAIPEGVAWGDYFGDDDFSVVSTIEPDTSVVSDDWKVVGEKTEASLPARAPRWCKHGNACQWANCKFRHERCEHYDRWVATRGKTRGCRCQQTDPRNCKSPEEGGCKYDHRDLSKLDLFVENVTITCEADMWEHFMPRGLEAHCSYALDVTNMRKYERGLLVRSLTSAGSDVVEFEDNDTWLHVSFVE
jgi:hypothetical protein